MREYRYKNNIFYYTEPWNGEFYKSSKFERFSEKKFNEITGLSFEQFYDQKINVEKNRSSIEIEQYIIENAYVSPMNKQSAKRAIKRLGINIQNMRFNKVLDKMIEKNIVKPIVQRYSVVCNKRAYKEISKYIIETKANNHILEIPRYKCLQIFNLMLSIDNTAKYEYICTLKG